MIGDINKVTAPSGVGGITDMQPRMTTEQRERDIGGKMRVSAVGGRTGWRVNMYVCVRACVCACVYVS